jgi:hypothetical protein
VTPSTDPFTQDIRGGGAVQKNFSKPSQPSHLPKLTLR